MQELTPSQKGAIAEAAVTAAAIELGFTVLRPLCEGRRYDLLLDLHPRLVRVQCKLGRNVGGCVEVRLRSSRLTPAGYVQTTYSAAEIDAVGVYCAESRECYLVPIAEVEGRSTLNLRTEPARNGQERRIRWAGDFVFPAVITALRARSSEDAVRL